ncbi:kelch repeat protein [Ostertagia ostertagi]
MLRKRYAFDVATLDDFIYAVGGSDGTQCLNIVERLDPRVGKWELLRPMSTHRSHLGSAALDGYLYAVGGRTGWNYSMSTVEQYNPLTNEWSTVDEMMVKRSGVKAVALNESLYAVGGFDGISYLGTVEVLDPGTDQWRIHSHMNTERCRAGVAVIRME